MTLKPDLSATYFKGNFSQTVSFFFLFYLINRLLVVFNFVDGDSGSNRIHTACRSAKFDEIVADGRGVAQIRDREFELIRDMMVMVVLAI